MKKTMIALAITGSLAISGIVTVAAQNIGKQDLLSSKEISQKALSYVKGKVYKIELEHKKIGPIYEVNVKSKQAKYELKLDAKTGELLEKSTTYTSDQSANKKLISLEDAKQIALKSVKGKIYKAKMDKSDYEYEITIIKGKYEYAIDINAYTGKILKIDKEKITALKGYKEIGLKKAKQIALSYINGVIQQAKYKRDEGLYVIHMKKNATNYNIHIDAYTGEIIQPGNNHTFDTNLGVVIGLEKAKQIALGAVIGTVIEAHLDSNDGVYEVKVQNGDVEHDFEINAKTGAIIKQDHESTIQNGFASIGTTDIGIERAKQIALSKIAGTVTAATFDQEDGVYEISITANGNQYQLEINAQTGAIINQDQENRQSISSNNDSTIISSQKAAQIALSKANGTVTKIDLEDDVYDVEIKDGTYEYEVEIDAKTGKILSFDKGYDD